MARELSFYKYPTTAVKTRIMHHAYHEFLAIDRPLRQDEIIQIRAESPASLVSTTGFIHEQGILDLQPDYLMRRYFDAHIGISNNHEVLFELRLPKEVVNAIQEIEASPVLEIETHGAYWFISWRMEYSGQLHHVGAIDASDWMSSLVPLREELLCGDQRSLYIGWLAAVSKGDVAEDDPEPMHWIGQPTQAQSNLADFLGISSDLLHAAVSAPSATLKTEDYPRLESWLMTLSDSEMRAAIRHIIQGRAPHAVRSLSKKYLAWSTGADAASSMQTAATLWTKIKNRSS